MAEFKERTGWAIVNRGGMVFVVSPFGRADAILKCVDHYRQFTPEKRKEIWARNRKRGCRAVKVRIIKESGE